MLKELFLSALLLFCNNCKADECKVIVQCKISLQDNEFICHQKEIFIKGSIIPDIINKTQKEYCELQSFEAWNIIEFKVFMYVECDKCGALHLIDYGCTNPNCPSRTL
jgi:hypothetical protein